MVFWRDTDPATAAAVVSILWSAVSQVAPPSVVQRSGTVTSPIRERLEPRPPPWSTPAPATPENTTPEMQLKTVKAAVVVSVAFTGPIPLRARMTSLVSSVPVQNSLLAEGAERIGSMLSSLVAFMILPISAGNAERTSTLGWAQTPGAPSHSILAIVSLVSSPNNATCGPLWHYRLRGWEVDSAIWGRKSYGHQYALSNKTTDRQKLSQLLMKLCEKTGRRLRRRCRPYDSLSQCRGRGQFWPRPTGSNPATLRLHPPPP